MFSSLLSLSSVFALTASMVWGTAERAKLMVFDNGNRTEVEIMGRTKDGELVEVKAMPQRFSVGKGISGRRVLVSNIPPSVESICATTVPNSGNGSGQSSAFILRSCSVLPVYRNARTGNNRGKGLGSRLGDALRPAQVLDLTNN